MKNYKIGFGIIVVAIFVLLKFWYANSNNSELFFLLKPTNFFITNITSTTSIFLTETGFYNNNLNIIINKSCSGFNFLIINFLMLAFLFLNKFNNRKMLFVAIPISFFLSYFATLFANVSRILFSVYTNKFTALKFSWMHQAEGTFIYLSVLISFYFIANIILKKEVYEKFA